ncbi:MAG: hypothetical protein KQJ78_01750 [Deltaproteobacteria bacterium]|nr:hypothetical protein [Deltaproteobacteria bacterium]
MQDQLKALAAVMRQELEKIPSSFRQEEAVRQTLICLLYGAVGQMGLLPLPGWKPPKSPRDRLDLVGLDLGGELPRVEMAFVIDPLVELPKVRSLEWVDCPHKVVVTFSPRKDKVMQTGLFLNPGLIHLNLFD